MLRRQNSEITRGHKKSSSTSRPSPSAGAPTSASAAAAKQQAHAAALYAFARSNERNSADMGFDKSTSTNTSAYTNHIARSQLGQQKENKHTRSASASAVEVGSKRRRSVRFVGKNADVPLGPKITVTGPRKVQSSNSLKPTTPGRSQNHTVQPHAFTTNSPVPAAYRPPSRCSSLGKVPGTENGGDDVYRSSMQAQPSSFEHLYPDSVQEQELREAELASNQSSYRKIRRAKSTVQPNSHGGATFVAETPDSSAAPRSWGVKAGKALRAPKSMSFLQHKRPQRDSSGGYDTAVQEARDKFLQQVEQQRLKSQPSFLFRPLNTSQHSQPVCGQREFRRSLRRPSSSTNSYGMPISSQGPIGLQHTGNGNGSLRSKARMASKSLKNKLKGLFRIGSSEDQALPEQEVQATRSHGWPDGDFQALIGPPSAVHEEYNNVPHPADDWSLSQAPWRHPSLHPVPSHQQLRSQAGSVQSMRSDMQSRASSQQSSRLPSWTITENSTATSRYAEADRARERERQRLSIINEVGTHVVGSSFNREPVEGAFNHGLYPPQSQHGYSTTPLGTPIEGQYWQPFPTISPSPAPLPFGGASMKPGPDGLFSPATQIQVDSARVYSALMKRLDETSPKAKLAQIQAEKASLRSGRSRANSIEPPTPIPPRRSSISSTPASVRTIRTVTAQDSRPESIRTVIQDGSPDRVSVRDFAPPAPMAVTGNDSGSVGYRAERRHNRNVSDATVVVNKSKPTYRAFPPPVMGDTPGSIQNSTPTAHKGPRRDSLSGSGERKGLRETKSTFFGTTDVTKITRVASPYRRAMREAGLSSGKGGSHLKSESMATDDSEPTSDPENWPMISGRAPGDATPEKKSKGKEKEIESGDSSSGSSHGSPDPSPAPTVSYEEEESSMYTPGKHGSAILLDRAIYRYSESGVKPTLRTSMSATSTEWKNWMRGEVEELERDTPLVSHVVPKKSMRDLQKKASNGSISTIRPIPVGLPKWEMKLSERAELERSKMAARGIVIGHVREGAQIHGDDVSIGANTPGSASLAAAKRRREQAQARMLAAAAKNVPKGILRKQSGDTPDNGQWTAFPPPPPNAPPPPPPFTARLGAPNTTAARLKAVPSNSSLKVGSVLTERVPSSSSDANRAASGSQPPIAYVRPSTASAAVSKLPMATTIRAVGSFDTATRKVSIASTATPTESAKRERNKLVRKSGRRVSSSSILSPGSIATPSPGLTSAVERQFGRVVSVAPSSGGSSRPGTANRPGTASRPGTATSRPATSASRSVSRAGASTPVPTVTVKWPGPIAQSKDRVEVRTIPSSSNLRAGSRNASASSAAGRWGNENTMPGKERFGFQTLTATRADTPIAGSGKEKEREEEVKAQVMGSKRMMDMFLSSRRRRVAGSEDSAAPAFI